MNEQSEDYTNGWYAGDCEGHGWRWEPSPNDPDKRGSCYDDEDGALLWFAPRMYVPQDMRKETV